MNGLQRPAGRYHDLCSRRRDLGGSSRRWLGVGTAHSAVRGGGNGGGGGGGLGGARGRARGRSGSGGRGSGGFRLGVEQTLPQRHDPGLERPRETHTGCDEPDNPRFPCSVPRRITERITIFKRHLHLFNLLPLTLSGYNSGCTVHSRHF